MRARRKPDVLLALLALAILMPRASTNAGDPWPNDFDKHIKNWKEVPLIPNAQNVWDGEKAPFPSLNWHVRVDNGEVFATATSSPFEQDHGGMPFRPT
jgi:hypothetical protein